MLLLAIVYFIQEDDKANKGIFGGNQPILRKDMELKFEYLWD